MKKLLSVLSVLVLGIVLVACGGKTYEVAMITDTGDIDDGS
ncbi:MAG TPA: BMP family ABC transporter substrate-binding protein, partial [Acholeplasmataceae bacterium]|nr:BMP family ABC transporter substrate-binding protein [Acholeplasmataceae bacterium]